MKFNDFVKGKGTEVDQFIGWLLASTAYVKSAHLETDSYARHKAYDFYYAEIQPLIDKFSEQYLGFSGKPYVASLPSASQMPKDTIKFMDEMIKCVEPIYDKTPRALHSILDDIVGVCYQTKYLLSLK